MRQDLDYDEYIKRWLELYHSKNYDVGLNGYFMRKSHEWSELDFGSDCYFARVLEVGAGTGIHIGYVRHGYDEYWITDHNPTVLQRIANADNCILPGSIRFAQEDATQLSFADRFFDRVIAAHVLEHLYQPHRVLREWVRVLKPGGILSLVLPCDPGLLWRMGRYAVARKGFIRAGIDYDYWIAREHVNPINNLIALIRYYFDNFNEDWFPWRVPSIDLNLFYIAHIEV